MTRFFLGCCVGLMAGLTLHAADYAQLPGHFGGYGSDESFAVADEFVLTSETRIRQITWWGENVPSPASKYFKVRIFADNAGQPGALLREIAEPSILKRKTGDFLIRGGHGEPDLYPEYQFTVVLKRPFIAKAGVKYWLSVLSEAGSQWTWEVSASEKNLGVQRSVFTDSILGPWTPDDYNTAFAIGPEPLSRPRKPLGFSFGRQ